MPYFFFLCWLARLYLTRQLLLRSLRVSKFKLRYTVFIGSFTVCSTESRMEVVFCVFLHLVCLTKSHGVALIHFVQMATQCSPQGSSSITEPFLSRSALDPECLHCIPGINMPTMWSLGLVEEATVAMMMMHFLCHYSAVCVLLLALRRLGGLPFRGWEEVSTQKPRSWLRKEDQAHCPPNACEWARRQGLAGGI